MTLSIKHSDAPRGAFAEYKYEIFDGTRLVAYYFHDYRGDEHWIEFVGGSSEDWPVGRMIDFIEGGGPSPLRLSPVAVAYLEQKLASE